jgi:chemotaxis protein MotA
MDIATVIGLIGGTALIVVSINLGGSMLLFLNAPGLLIVLGGTLAANFIKFSLKDVISSFKVGMKAFFFKVASPEELIESMVTYAKIAKKEGLIALEKEEPSDAFAANALKYLVDGYDETLIKEMLIKDLNLTVKRHTLGKNVFKGMGDSAPAFGMIGTLIGLVQMLSSMSDPRSIGPAMAVALLTTLYGALVANFICLPLSEKLALRSEQEQETKKIVIDACVGMSQGWSPLVLEESLKIYLTPKDRRKASADKEAMAA